jgi:hypothetical protein
MRAMGSWNGPKMDDAPAGDYFEFLDRKAQLEGMHGFEPLWLPDCLFDFQRALVDWSLRKGRAANLSDCGLGKSVMELTWAENVYRKTGKPVLIVTPLAVAAQTVHEAEKFGMAAAVSRDGSLPDSITVTNYERLHLFDPSKLGGVVCDESSAIKNFDGVRRAIVTELMRKLPYRLLATATAAPNDYVELGTSSEALGYLGHMDMLGRFFVNAMNNSNTKGAYRGQRRDAGLKWRFKGHAEQHFWRWVCSWARACRKPSDIGFSDDRFKLTELVEQVHIVKAKRLAPGMLFELPAEGLHEQREEQRRTIVERCERAAALINAHNEPAVAWCHLNDEGRMLSKLIPGAIEIKGADEPERKEELFDEFGSGRARVLIIKPKIGAWGLNWQHCAHMTWFPSHSFEQYYQAVRRCWRFGQTRNVHVDIVTTEGGLLTQENLQRKAAQADEMFTSLVAHMNNAMAIDRSSTFNTKTEIPAWLS